jgi:hypothetical protein
MLRARIPLSVDLLSSTVLLPRSLVLAAAVLVVVTGQGWRWRHRMATPIGALAAGTTTWILIGRGNGLLDS